MKRDKPNDFFEVCTNDYIAEIRIARLPATNEDLIVFGADLKMAIDHFSYENKVRVILMATQRRNALDMNTDIFEAAESEFGQSGRLVPSITTALSRTRLAVIGALDGRVSGIGLELALCCDVRIATAASTFGMPHVQFGLMPWDGGTQRLTRIVGQANAMELIFFGDMIDAQKAFRIGLVHRIVEEDDCLSKTARELAVNIAEKSPLSLAYAKEAIINGMDLSLAQGLQLETDLYFLMHSSEDRKEGLEAFRDKRKPTFSGK